MTPRTRLLGGLAFLTAFAWRWLRMPALFLLVLLLALMFLEESLIFFPTRYPAGDWRPAGLAFEDAWFEAADGVRLHGWYLPHPRSRATLVLAHGNAGHLADRAPFLRFLHERLEVSLLMFDYRGYGRSDGRPEGQGILLDARAARDWLAQRTGEAGEDLVLHGASLGGAVMVDLAASAGARGLVLEATFSSLAEVAQRHYSWLPVRQLLRTRLDSAAKIPGYHGPLLMFHGDSDDIVPAELGRRLFAAANEPKRWVDLRGLGHNDALYADPAYLIAWDEFLRSLPPRRGPHPGGR